MSDITIEAEQPVDAEAIDGVVRAAFAHHLEVGDMVAAIRASPRYRPGLALVARVGSKVIGFVMVSGTDLVADDATQREVLTLTPLAVLPEFQRRGVGTALVRAALDEADRQGEPLVVLEGSPRYYGRLGFTLATTHGIVLHLPDGAPPEAGKVYLGEFEEASQLGQLQLAQDLLLTGGRRRLVWRRCPPRRAHDAVSGVSSSKLLSHKRVHEPLAGRHLGRTVACRRTRSGS